VRLVTEGNLDGAILEFDRAVGLLPNFAAAYLNRGSVRHLLGRHTQAIADFGRAIELSPGAAAYCNRAAARLAAWDFDGVIQDCDAALVLKPDFPSAFLHRGYAYYHQRDTAQAESNYRRAFELDPAGFARTVVDQIQRSMRENARAVLTDCEKHLKYEAGDFHSLARRGIVSLFQGRTDEAGVDFTRYRELNPPGAERLAALIAEVEKRKSAGRK
jgi:tetratricopeptide (TPR) repeat protein